MSVTQYITLSASSAKTATANYEPNANNRYARGVVVYINITASSATPSVVFTIQGYDEASDAWYDILASAAQTGTAAVRMRVHPSLAAVTNLAANDLLPRRWRVRAVHADSDSITFSLGACLIP